MKIDISEVRKQRNVPFRFHFCERLPGDLPDDAAYAGPVELGVTLQADAAGVTGEIQLRVPLRYRCARCLAEFEQELFHRWAIKLYEREPENEGERAEDWLLIKDNQIDLRDMVEEAIILSIPFRRLCAPDCRGLCAGCGAQLNHEECRCQGEELDPRWEKLKNFKA